MEEHCGIELTVRLTPEQAEMLREMAAQRDLSLESMAQVLIVSELNREFLRDARLHRLKEQVLEEQRELTVEERLRAVEELSKMDLPVSDWEEMEREIESMWEEPLYDDEPEAEGER